MQEQFEAGMHVRYGGTGICLIERIGEVPYPGEKPTRLCYILRPVRNSGMEISVPLDNELLCAKMQPLRSKAEIDRMLDGGDAQTLLRMIRCILKRRSELQAAGKRLAAADDNARKDAARLLDEEFGFSLGMTAREASQYICDRLQVEKEVE